MYLNHNIYDIIFVYYNGGPFPNLFYLYKKHIRFSDYKNNIILKALYYDNFPHLR